MCERLELEQLYFRAEHVDKNVAAVYTLSKLLGFILLVNHTVVSEGSQG